MAQFSEQPPNTGEEEKIVIIDIVTPTHTHSSYAKEAAVAGKHVICEKPLTGYFGDPTIPIEERKDVGETNKLTMLKEVLKECEILKNVIQKQGTIFGYAENWVDRKSVV